AAYKREHGLLLEAGKLATSLSCDTLPVELARHMIAAHREFTADLAAAARKNRMRMEQPRSMIVCAICGHDQCSAVSVQHPGELPPVVRSIVDRLHFSR